jgi:1-deoxy-D-xylulose-5-phosphate synthase
VLAQHERVLVVEEGTIVNGFGAYMSTVIARQDASVRVAVHGVPDRVIHAAPRARQLALAGLDSEGIAARVRALREQESEAVAG